MMAQLSSHHFFTSTAVIALRLLGRVSGVDFFVGEVDMMVAEVEGDEGVK
jgi:hypothetical protein